MLPIQGDGDANRKVALLTGITGQVSCAEFSANKTLDTKAILCVYIFFRRVESFSTSIFLGWLVFGRVSASERIPSPWNYPTLFKLQHTSH